MFNPFKTQANNRFQGGFSGNQMTMIPSSSVFDENKIDFKLNGGPKYTDVLIASAVFNDGDSKGFACPLNCKWFYTLKNNELIEIEGVKSSFYQPSLDDIGHRIWVHAHPTNGIDEYQGMPMFSEVGPLVMDDEILSQAQEVISRPEDSRQFFVHIKSSNTEYLKQKGLPLKCNLSATDSMIVFESQNGKEKFFSILFSRSYPSIKILRNTNNLIEIYINESEKLILEIEPNLRDVLTLVVRSLLNKWPLANYADEEQKLAEPHHLRSKTMGVHLNKFSEIEKEDPDQSINSMKNVSLDINQSSNSMIVDSSVEYSYEVEEVLEEDKSIEVENNSIDKSEIVDKPKTNIRRQKLATGKKKKEPKLEAESEIAKVEEKPKEEAEHVEEPKNPFKSFFENLTDKSKGFASNLIREKDELLMKLQKSTTPRNQIINQFETLVGNKQNQNLTGENIEIKNDEKGKEDTNSSDYLDNIQKISQLSHELTKRNEYLETAENKILQLKSDLAQTKNEMKEYEAKILKLTDIISFHKENDKKIAEEVAKNQDHMNFLEIENTMLKWQKQKFLSACPSGIDDLSHAKLIPKKLYNVLKNAYKQMKSLSKSQRHIEQKSMQLFDNYTLLIYTKKTKWSDTGITDSSPSAISTKDLVGENQRLIERIKELEETCQKEIHLRESIEAERNSLKNKQISQSKDLEKMRRQIDKLKEGKENKLEKSKSEKDQIQGKQGEKSDFDEENEDFIPKRQSPFSLDSFKEDDMYDLRMGESSYTNNPGDNMLDMQIRQNDVLRAEIEDQRQRLTESDEIMKSYKTVLEDEIAKNKKLKSQIHKMKLMQEYGYDDESNSLHELEDKIENLRMLLQEKNIMLSAQKDINKQLMIKLDESITNNSSAE